MTGKFSIYYNPQAGSGRARDVLKELRVTGYRLPEDSDYRDCRDIVVIGGDGTFNRLLNELERPEEHRFVLLAGGTSNSLYSQLSGKESAADKMRRYLDGAAFRPVDVPQLICNGQTWRFVNEASVGFAAAIAREIEKRQTKRLFNRLHINELAYIATAFRCWRKDEPMMLSLNNNRRISGDLYPCPNAQLDDGLIDVFTLRCPRLRLPIELTRLVKATREVHSLYSSREQVREGHWTFDKPLPVEIDGNPIGETTEIHLSLYDKQIQVL